MIETLESAKTQTYQKLELIVSDDCSTDDTVKLCHEWIEINKSRFVKTKLITVPLNTGLPANCNRGAKAANGVWLKFIAGDDVLLPDCIEANWRYANNNSKIDVLLSNMELYNNSCDRDNFKGVWTFDKDDYFFSQKCPPKDQYQQLLLADKIGNTPTLFITKKTIDHVGYYDEKYHYLEDYPFWLKLTRSGVKLYFMDQVTVKYRKHPEAIQNMTQRCFLKPSFFRNEDMRKEYVYPYLPKSQLISKKYFYYLAILFRYLNKNEYVKSHDFIFSVLTFRLNIFKWLLSKFTRP
jgi:alpha-1,3-rhamnosyltransferase